MSKFKDSGKKELPAITTASLPDMVFMLLFFFMVATQMKEVDLKIVVKAPTAYEVKKLEKKSLVSNIYIGSPKRQFQKVFGLEPRIQLNDQFSEIKDIADYIQAEREQRSEADVPFMTTSLKIDQKCKMGVVTDVKQELRRVGALKLNYSTKKGLRTN
jgi:biopolymer transport protein ExbD